MRVLHFAFSLFLVTNEVQALFSGWPLEKLFYDVLTKTPSLSAGLVFSY